MRSHAALIVLAAALLAGCNSKERDRREFAYADAVTAPPPIPTGFQLANADAQVQLALPPNIDHYPGLHGYLYNTGKDELTEFAQTAAADRAYLAKKGVSQPQPYERRIVWTITSMSPHLISLRQAWYDDTGGIKADHGSTTLLWDRVHNTPLLQTELFKPDIDTKALDDELCQATIKAKEARVGPTDAKTWTCPTFLTSNAVLVPSATPYRVGGMMFLFDPHMLGNYAEGDYEVLIPQDDFRKFLAPAWAADFVGAPGPMVRPKA
jgi:hypothetical protein